MPEPKVSAFGRWLGEMLGGESPPEPKPEEHPMEVLARVAEAQQAPSLPELTPEKEEILRQIAALDAEPEPAPSYARMRVPGGFTPGGSFSKMAAGTADRASERYQNVLDFDMQKAMRAKRAESAIETDAEIEKARALAPLAERLAMLKAVAGREEGSPESLYGFAEVINALGDPDAKKALQERIAEATAAAKAKPAEDDGYGLGTIATVGGVGWLVKRYGPGVLRLFKNIHPAGRIAGGATAALGALEALVSGRNTGLDSVGKIATDAARMGSKMNPEDVLEMLSRLAREGSDITIPTTISGKRISPTGYIRPPK